MRIRVLECRFSQKLVHTRIPFKFGTHVLRSVPLAELSVTVESSSGQRAVGRSSDLLVPKWFEKNPDSSPEEDSAALAASAETAAAVSRTAGVGTVFDLWSDIYSEQVGTRDHQDSDVLVRGFGVAMVERAMIDAVCRIAGKTFHGALCDGVLGFESGRILPETESWTPAQLSPPVKSIAVRHTVGMLDPLTVAEIAYGERVEDGLPQALEEDIASYGVRWFKIKVCGDAKVDAQRLRDVVQVVFENAGDDVHFTLDGNEQCVDLEAFAGMLEDIRTDPACGKLIERIKIIEQPLPRGDTFAENKSLKRLAKIAPVIIDEADTDATAFTRAIELGYSGVSIKACKGVFRAVANRALIDVRGERGLFQSAEDLTNLGSIPLQQDLALQATLGMRNAERNGHHYFRGLDHLSTEVQAELTGALPELYIREGDLTRVRIERGSLDLTGVVGGVGFGGPLGSVDDRPLS